MEQKSVQVGDALRFGWETLKANPGPLVGGSAIAGLAPIVPGFFVEGPPEESTLPAFLAAAAGLLLSAIVALGLLGISVRLVDRQPVKFSDLFAYSSPVLLLKVIVGAIVYSATVVLGLVLLVVPGIIWGIQFSFVYFLMVDRRLGPFEAMSRSSRLTKGAKWGLFRFYVVFLAIDLAGTMCFYVGSFVTRPLTLVAAAWVYRRLEEQSKSVATPDAAKP